MNTKPIKISEENYTWLIRIAGELQKIEGKSVSVDEALTYVKKGKKIGNADFLLKFAGSWKLTDKEVENIRSKLNEGWKKWKIRSV